MSFYETQVPTDNSLKILVRLKHLTSLDEIKEERIKAKHQKEKTYYQTLSSHNTLKKLYESTPSNFLKEKPSYEGFKLERA